MAERTTLFGARAGRLLYTVACTFSIVGVTAASLDCSSVSGVRANFASNTFVCLTDVPGTFLWTLTRSVNDTVILGECSSNCEITDSSLNSSLSLTANNISSQLVIDTTVPNIKFVDFFNGSIIACRRGSEERNWTTDYVHPGDLESCDVQFRTDSWRVSGKCEVKGLSSSLGCYKCWWISTLQSSSREVRVEGQLRMSETATCVLDTSFPPAQGRYSYHVEMYAQSHLPATFVGTDEVLSPSRAWNLTHTCPAQGVAEGSDLTCHCKVAGDTGSPNATVLWGGTGNNSDQLTLRDVTRADTGRQFECRLLWNGTVLASVTYVLTTFCSEDVQSKAQARAEGIGIGIGICLAIAAVAAVVFAFIFWRRGKLDVLCSPCPLRVGHCLKDATEAEEATISDVQNKSHDQTCRQKPVSERLPTSILRETVGHEKSATRRVNPGLISSSPSARVAPPDTTGKKTKSAAPVGALYDAIDRTQVSTGNSYEALQVSASTPSGTTSGSLPEEDPPDEIYEETDQPLYGNT